MIKVTLPIDPLGTGKPWALDGEVDGDDVTWIAARDSRGRPRKLSDCGDLSEHVEAAQKAAEAERDARTEARIDEHEQESDMAASRATTPDPNATPTSDTVPRTRRQPDDLTKAKRALERAQKDVDEATGRLKTAQATYREILAAEMKKAGAGEGEAAE